MFPIYPKFARGSYPLLVGFVAFGFNVCQELRVQRIHPKRRVVSSSTLGRRRYFSRQVDETSLGFRIWPYDTCEALIPKVD